MSRKNNLTSNIYFADFETLTKNSIDFKNTCKTGVFLWGLKKIDQEKMKYDYSLKSFIDYCINFKKNTIIYFHNLSFDGNFIYKYLFKNYLDFYKDEYTNKNKKYNFWSIFKQGRKIYNIEINLRKREKNKDYKYSIIFKCTYNLLNTSIASLAKNYNLHKHNKNDRKILEYLFNIKSDEDFYNSGTYNLKENTILNHIFLKYLENDINVAKLAYLDFKENVENSKYSFNYQYNKRNISVQNILTVASLTQKLAQNATWKYNFLIAKNFHLKTYDDYNFAKNFYRGGLSQFNEMYQEEDFYFNGFSIDINSSYPFSMTKLLPFGSLSKDKKEIFTKEFLTYYVVDCEFKIKEKYFFLPVIKNESVLTRYARFGKQKLYLLKEEFEILKKIYDFKIIKQEIYYSNASKFLEPFIRDFYNFKQNASGGKKQTYKILLNTTYGGFCKKPFYPSELIITKEHFDFLKKNNIKNINNFEIVGFSNNEIKVNDQTILKTIKVIDKEKIAKRKKFPNILVGATITAYSRIYLLETILKIGVENFLYTDTDSIFFKWNKDINKIKEKINIDNDELGAWKIEFNFNSGRILGSKRYIFENSSDSSKIKTALAGIKKINDSTKIRDILKDGVFIPNAKYQIVEDENGIFLDFKEIKILRGTI